MIGAYWTVPGLFMVLIGVLLLFRYGMPYRVRKGGAGALLLEGTDYKAIEVERRHDRLGKLGLLFIILGTGAQIVGSLI